MLTILKQIDEAGMALEPAVVAVQPESVEDNLPLACKSLQQQPISPINGFVQLVNSVCVVRALQRKRLLLRDLAVFPNCVHQIARFGITEGRCPSKQSDQFKYFSDDRLDFMKQRVRKESGLQKLEPESYREYQQRHAVIFKL